MSNNDHLPSWNLASLYKSPNDPKISKDFAEVTERAKRFQTIFEGNIDSLDSDVFGSAIVEYEEINEMLGKISSYSFLYYAENMSDEKRSSFYQNWFEKINDIATRLLFFTLEINRMSDKELEKLGKDSEVVAKYSPWLRDVRSFKKYQLSDEVERVLHEKAITSEQSWVRLFDTTLADLKFPFKGKKVACSEILNKLSSKDASERKTAAKSIGKVFQDNIKIFTTITNVLAKNKEIEDNWRGFQHPISSRNLANLIEDDITEALLDAVKANYRNISHRYYELKATWFGKKSLNYWDRNAPLPEQDDSYIPFDKAKEIVLSAYKEFSPQMAKIGTKFFEKNWIDAKLVDGKDSGAFSHPTVSSANPFILLNYHGKVRDVMTLAHELGHGVHQYLAAKQGDLMAHTPLTLAETASVFGEQITFRKLLSQESSAEKKKALLASKVEDMINTVVRQVAFCQFEKIIHSERKRGELSTDQICEAWMQVQSESLGPGISFDEEYQYYWCYISHFIHSPFYVYSYAFGDCMVNSLYKKFQQQPEGFEDKYIAMLSAGGTLRHKELLAPFGLDAKHPDFWQEGLNVISEFIDELEKY